MTNMSLTKDPIDSSTYLNAALENSLPIIFQASLNAIGQNEIDAEGYNKVGYLMPVSISLSYS